MKQDYEKATLWLSKAAMAGNARAMYNLGVLYAGGLGVTKNEAQALNWYEQAVAGGEWMALLAISMAYREGNLGLPQDTEKADEFYRKFIEAQVQKKQ